MCHRANTGAAGQPNYFPFSFHMFFVFIFNGEQRVRFSQRCRVAVIYLFNMVNKGSESLKVASALFRPQSLNYTLFDQI